MSFEPEQKVSARHLKRNAYLYVRQSTLRQVVEHTESTKRQYALRQRAVALGWSADKIIVIDSDLGQSGASAADREGFQKLVTEVSMQRAGIVLGLEVSRLARNSSDWHRLLEICALTDTLILDKCDAFRNVELTCEKGRPIGAEARFCSTFLMRSSESLQPRNELGVMAPGSCFGLWLHEWLGFRQGLAFCFQIESQILVGGIDAGVA